MIYSNDKFAIKVIGYLLSLVSECLHRYQSGEDFISQQEGDGKLRKKLFYHGIHYKNIIFDL